MKKGLVLLCSLFLVVALIGCASTRVYKATKERVDIEVSGNQGIIYGPTPASHRVANPNRELCAVDIELPTMGEVKTTVKKTPGPAAESKGTIESAPVVSQEQPQQIPEAPKKTEKIK